MSIRRRFQLLMPQKDNQCIFFLLFDIETHFIILDFVLLLSLVALHQNLFR